jgi:hypothetical protein
MLNRVARLNKKESFWSNNQSHAAFKPWKSSCSVKFKNILHTCHLNLKGNTKESLVSQKSLREKVNKQKKSQYVGWTPVKKMPEGRR